MSTTVALQPSDAPERIIHVPLAVANMSVTIKNMLEGTPQCVCTHATP